MADVLSGGRVVHTAQPGSVITRLAGQAALAIVTGPAAPPYYVFADGSTKPVNPPPVDGDPMPGMPGRGLLSDYDPA